MQRLAVPLTLIAASIFAGFSLAKLPPPSDEAKAKAAEATAKKAWTEKVAGYQLCKSMEKTADTYYADAKKSGKQTKPPLATPPCTDPGPYAAEVPKAAKSVESAGAHSPPQPATSPPSTKEPQAEQGKK